MNAMLLLTFFAVTFCLESLSNIFTISPSSSILATVNTNACYASCESCQVKTQMCEDCFSPYFIKDTLLGCIVSPSFVLSSSPQELNSDFNFKILPSSWSGVTTVTQCTPKSTDLLTSLYVIGPFSNQQITYTTHLPLHSYVIVRFFLIAMNWDALSQLQILVQDQNKNKIQSRSVTFKSYILKQQLCSTTSIDQRMTVTMKLQDRTTTSIKIHLSLIGNGKYSISTWAVLTGNCDANCEKCAFSNEPTNCLTCQHFTIKDSNNMCSNNCGLGFQPKQFQTNAFSCQKCSILTQTCPTPTCTLTSLNLGQYINPTTCQLLPNSPYDKISQVSSPAFSESLFTVNGVPSVLKCSSYSVVGPADINSPITRIYPTFPFHLSLSITFNAVLINQLDTSQKALFTVFIDGYLASFRYLLFENGSSICNSMGVQSITTFLPSLFLTHSSTSNVNITITSDAFSWGIRDLSIVYQICDKICLQCSPKGCLVCPVFYQVSAFSCSETLKGFTVTTNSQGKSNTISCEANCLECKVQGATTYCTQCISVYSNFGGKCIKKADAEISATLVVDWTHSSLINNCIISNNFLNGTQTKMSFLVSQSVLKTVYNVSKPHNAIYVGFYMMKIDNWEKNQSVEIYINDLLVKNVTFEENKGNFICFNQKQPQQLQYYQFLIDDASNNITVKLQQVTYSQRSLGVSGLKIFPFGRCINCNASSTFFFKLLYQYDNTLNIFVYFNQFFQISNNQFILSFQLKIDGLVYPYKIRSNNGITYVLQVMLNTQLINSIITVSALNTDVVQTDLSSQINQFPFFTNRMLQKLPQIRTLSNASASVIVQRFTPLPDKDIVNGVNMAFVVISYLVLIVGLISFVLGCQTACIHTVHNLQRIWLHIFIASLSIPTSLKFALNGFSLMQNQELIPNFVAKDLGIPQQVYYETPASYQQYFGDTTFLRNIYNIGFAALLLFLFYIIVYFLLYFSDYYTKFLRTDSFQGLLWRHIVVTFKLRPFFVFNSVIFYQYLTLVIAVLLQLLSANMTNQGVWNNLNYSGAIISLIFVFIYPIIAYRYLSHKNQDMKNTGKEVSFNNRYSEIYYRFLPSKLWSQTEPDNIGFSHHLYNIYRYFQLLFTAFVAINLSATPFIQVFLLLLNNVLHLIIVLASNLNYTLFFRVLKACELVCFIALEVVIIIANGALVSLTTDSFNTLGSVGILLLTFIISFSVARTIYTFVKIFFQYYGEAQSFDEEEMDTLQMRNINYKVLKVHPLLRQYDQYDSFNLEGKQKIDLNLN